MTSSRKHYHNNKQYYLERNYKVREEKRAYIRRYKERPCKDCGVQYPYFVMELHHLEPSDKLHTPAHLCNKGWGVLHAELQKCVVLCANCHRFRTYDGE